jgi:hypothetical protein
LRNINTNLINSSNYCSNVSNILQSNINTNYLNLTYLTSNLIFNILNISNIYSSERHYPSKLWDTIDPVSTITYNGLTAYNVNFNLNTNTITYGSGIYSLTFSNKFTLSGTDYPGGFSQYLFDYVTIQNNTNGGNFLDGSVQFDASGVYIGSKYLGESTFKGCWFFLKLPVQISLTKIIIIGYSNYTVRNPGLWKIYGSNDGINWDVINDASNYISRLTVTDYSNSSYKYTKILNTPSNLYNYYGMCVSALAGASNELSFAEFEIYGKEFIAQITSDIIPLYSTPIYISSNILVNNILPQYITSNQLNVSNLITSNYASNISNVIITNTSNYASNISNVLTLRDATNLINSSNYASNISNILLSAIGTGTGTNINSSNYTSNISNVIITNTSNYTSNISNVIITNTSNYASNISNVLLINYNLLNTNTSNYTSNISNVIITNTSNYASNISNVLTIRDATNLINSSNYASNIYNVLLTNINTNFLKLDGTNTMTGPIITNSIIGGNLITLNTTSTNSTSTISFKNNSIY